jgi:CDP-glycerol glycerophosphotransferase (TagB/SpsB family)
MIHPSKFVLVGRPQLEGIKQAPAKAPKRKTVLIAPTWGGSAEGEVYTSLALAPAYARELIRLGHRVVFRPHPFSHRDPSDRAIIEQVWALLKADGKDHLYGPAAESQLTVTECINLCDVLISDISGIVSDWLYSLKPYLLVSMDETAAEFTKRYPIAEGAVVLTQKDALSEELLADSEKLSAKRKQVRSYYIAGADSSKPSELFMKATRAALG